MEDSKQVLCLCAHCKKKLYSGNQVFFVQRFDMDAPGGPAFVDVPTCSFGCAMETKNAEVSKWNELAMSVRLKMIHTETLGKQL